MNKAIALFGLLIALLLTGCSTTPLSFEDDPKSAPGQKMPLYILGVTLQNTFKPCCQPRLSGIRISNQATGEITQDGIRWKIIPTTPARNNRITGNTGTERPLSLPVHTELTPPHLDGLTYLVLLEAAPNNKAPITYIIEHLTGVSDTRVIQGRFQTPLHAELPRRPDGVFYLGHLSATVRERADNEFRAGPVQPEMDQFLAGFSTGTFDVEIEDRYDEDIATLDIHQPISRTIPIRKALLPAFDRDKAQQSWEAR